jgi:hypothetical protein
MPSITCRSGRRPISPHEASITVKLPRAVIDAVDAFAVGEFGINRAAAIGLILARGLDALGRPVVPSGRGQCR